MPLEPWAPRKRLIASPYKGKSSDETLPLRLHFQRPRRDADSLEIGMKWDVGLINMPYTGWASDFQYCTDFPSQPKSAEILSGQACTFSTFLLIYLLHLFII